MANSLLFPHKAAYLTEKTPCPEYCMSDVQLFRPTCWHSLRSKIVLQTDFCCT